jgi:hypothetical protein
LAKYHEHFNKSYSSAISIVEEAVKRMQICKADINSHDYGSYQKELLHRLKRLEKKSKNVTWQR